MYNSSSNGATKPAGWRAFNALARQLVSVPKEEADAQVEADRKERKANRRRKK